MSSRLPNILFVADKFGYANGVMHGGTTYFLNILPALVNAGVSVTAVFLRDPHPAAESLYAQGLSPIFLAAHGPDPRVFVRLLRLARRNDCEIIHATGFASTLMARAVARVLPVRTVVHVHDLLIPPKVVRALQGCLARSSDMGICVSRATQQVAVDGYHVRRDRVRVVHNGIHLERFRDVPDDAGACLRAELGLPEGARLLSIIARIYPVKGHRTLLRMMTRIVRDCPDAVLLVVGDGPERGACELLTRELDLHSNVLFLGQRDDVAEILAASEIVVIASESEGLPLTAIESLAAGTPVVAFDVGGLGEVVEDEVTGRLVPFGDTDAFADATVSLLNMSRSSSPYAARARVAAERFGMDRHVEQLIQCYRELAE